MTPDYVEKLRASLVYVAERNGMAEQRQAYEALQGRADLPLGSLPSLDDLIARSRAEANRLGYSEGEKPWLLDLAFEVAGRASTLRAGAT